MKIDEKLIAKRREAELAFESWFADNYASVDDDVKWFMERAWLAAVEQRSKNGRKLSS